MQATVYIATSLDGFIARPDGRLDWLLGAPSVPAEDYGYQAFIDTVDVIVMGRRTYEKVLTFGAWPYVGKRVVVLASLPVAIAAERASDVEWMHAAPGTVAQTLAARGHRHAYVDGGVTVQRFIAEGLVQRIILTRVPVLIGSGAPLFGPLAGDISLRHVATRSYPNGFVQSEYVLSEPNPSR